MSSSGQKEDLERQLDRLRDFAAANGLHVVGEFKETGSGLNGHRKALLKILGIPSFSIIVVEHRDRLASLAIAFRSSRLCGQPFAVSADASWHLLRNEYLWHGPVADTTMAGRTEQGVNAPKGVV
ncbi:MAG: recombinase family protein [Nitrososphaerota archaeon]|nr:recombinase family protein [Nitrososphaerota archaeon]